ncbi:hypothetical protein MC885_013348, partial [Smutsia gigantea]
MEILVLYLSPVRNVSLIEEMKTNRLLLVAPLPNSTFNDTLELFLVGIEYDPMPIRFGLDFEDFASLMVFQDDTGQEPQTSGGRPGAKLRDIP